MNHDAVFNDRFEQSILLAADSIRGREFQRAYDLIAEAIRLNPDAPEPHNLLGVWFELKGDGDRARRHYRAAYSLDPTFGPACRNLERIFTMYDLHPGIPDLGGNPEERLRGGLKP